VVIIILSSIVISIGLFRRRRRRRCSPFLFRVGCRRCRRSMFCVLKEENADGRRTTSQVWAKNNLRSNKNEEPTFIKKNDDNNNNNNNDKQKQKQMLT